MLHKVEDVEERFTNGMNKLLEDAITYSANLKEDIQSKEEMISQLNKMNYNLSEQLENLKRENYQLKERGAILTKENTISLEKLEALKLASQSESNDNIKVERKIKDFFKEVKEELDSKINLLNDNIAKLRKENMELQKKLNAKDRQLIRVIRENEFKNQELLRVKNKYQDLVSLKNDINQKVSMLSKENYNLKKELAKKDKDLKNISGHIAVLEDSLRNLEKLKAGLSQRKEIIGEIKSGIEKLSNDYVAIKKEDEENKKNIEALKIELGRRAERILNLEEELAKRNKEVAELSQRIDSYIKEIALIKQSYIDSNLEKARLIERLKLNENKIKELKAILSDIAKMNSQLRERIDSIPNFWEEEISQKQTKDNPPKSVEVELNSVTH
ncbi:MAG: hypothetical protein NC820_05695 [Candidatus Omnitrophica bacterium]|nr:hypothetical protein [Candidatus Omnitrophota bacterium]